eukprot:766243-Hanusia_phi.AAC.5
MAGRERQGGMVYGCVRRGLGKRNTKTGVGSPGSSLLQLSLLLFRCSAARTRPLSVGSARGLDSFRSDEAPSFHTRS